MAKNKNYHVISRKDGWALKREGASKAAGVFSTQDEAMKASNKFRSQNHDVIVHRADGAIREWRKKK